ncbi:uncharacterized protein DFL_001514 [Arthrobotrys flagrans]|uniref:J domain-containing protein n=1 Tax=Arthrobotrys flagrans TaxID=97331 RepID=A0A437A804_ARTFL|nr:hypothetical protein DFL_001514 [Arthrobotrys flagrans]
MDPEVISHYYVLEVEHDARDVQIKLGFRRQSLKWHPDKNPGADKAKRAVCNAMMAKLNDAYTCLRDPDARKLYELRCASIVFTHPDDPGNWFREKFEAERRAREEERQRQRREEQERNAARQREREAQERRRREAEEREQQRREAEDRERRERAERARQAAEERERTERERQEQERRWREQRQQQQSQSQRRHGAQEHQSRTTEPNGSTFSHFTEREWEGFFNILRVLIMLQEAASENRRQSSGTSSTSFSGSTASNNSYRAPRSSFSGSTTSSSSTPRTSFGESTASNGSTPRTSFGESTTPNSGASRPSFSTPNPPPETPSPTREHETDDDFTTGSTEYSYSSYQQRRGPGFVRLPQYSSRARWSQAELDALLKLRRNHPWETWDNIAYRLNSEFGNGRNGNAVRLKHSKHTR